MKKILYTLILCCSIGHFAYADCDINNDASAGTQDCVGMGGMFGQAFTACETGDWTTLDFNIESIAGTGTATVYVAEGGLADNTLASAKIVGTFDMGGMQQFDINLPVTDGQTYIWWVELPEVGGFEIRYDVNTEVFGDASGIFYVHSERVGAAGGAADGNSGALRTTNLSASRSSSGGSVAFNVSIVASAIASAPIPTLSQWGLLVMALLVLNLGLIFIRQKESILL